MSVLVGCGGADTVSSGGDQADKGRPTTVFASTADEPSSGPDHQVTPRFDDVERFRDYAAFAYSDRFGRQHLSQWLLADDGITYFSRTCPIAERNGVAWSECASWSLYGQPVGELGTGSFVKVNGINSYVYTEGLDADGNALQFVVQTAFADGGEERRGRVCPIDASDGPTWSECSDWEKLRASSTSLRVAEAAAFRDEVMFTYKSDTGEDMVSQTLLSVDGSDTWNRSCATSGGSPFLKSDCAFGGASKVFNSLDVQEHTINGRGAYVYFDGAQQVFAETVILADGTTVQKRECPLYGKGFDREACGAWTSFSLKELHKSQGPL